MRALQVAAVILSVAFVGAGCNGKTRSLEGTWTAQTGTGPVTFEFKSDHTFTLHGNTARGTFTQTNDYKLAEGKLTMTATDIDISGLSPEQLEKVKAKAELGVAKTVDVLFASDDEVTLSGSTAPNSGTTKITLKRTAR